MKKIFFSLLFNGIFLQLISASENEIAQLESEIVNFQGKVLEKVKAIQSVEGIIAKQEKTSSQGRTEKQAKDLEFLKRTKDKREYDLLLLQLQIAALEKQKNELRAKIWDITLPGRYNKNN